MDREREFEDLQRLAAQLGVEVRTRQLHGAPGNGGGLCRVRGQWVVILNSQATSHEKRAALAEALRTVQGPTEPSGGPGLAGLGPKGRRRSG